MGFILTSIMISAFVILALTDLYLFIRYGTEETISYNIRKWSQEYPIVAFIIGFIVGFLAKDWFF